jgi:hypothetical protein
MKKAAMKKPWVKRKGGPAVETVAGPAQGDGTNRTDGTDAPGRNPLLDLPEEKRSKLFVWLRECPYEDAVQHMLKDEGIGEVTRMQVSEFFQSEAEFHWGRRIERAAVEANALVQLVERSPVQFSSGILAALGQEAFRQVASGQVEPEAMGKMAMLFLRARSDERTSQMQELKREKLRLEMQGQLEQALEKLAEEVDQHPAARKAFEALREEICQSLEGELAPAEEVNVERGKNKPDGADRTDGADEGVRPAGTPVGDPPVK